MKRESISIAAIIVILFLLVETANAALNYYVDPNQPDDTGDGLSPLTAKKTIDAAYEAAVAAGEDNIINFMPGVYDDTTQGTNFNILLDKDTAVTFQSYTSQVTLTTNDSPGCVKATQTTSTKQISFKNIKFTKGELGNRFIYIANDCVYHLYFEDCEFDAIVDKPLILTGTDTSKLRKLSFINCTHTCSASSDIRIDGARLLYIKNCAFTNNYTSYGYGIFDLRGVIYAVVLKDSTLQSAEGVFYPSHSSLNRIEQLHIESNNIILASIAAGPFYGVKTRDSIFRSIVIKDNTFSSPNPTHRPFFIVIGGENFTNGHLYTIIGNSFITGNLGQGVGIRTGNGCVGTISHNYFENLRWGTFTYDTCLITNNIISSCVNGSFVQGHQSFIINNTYISKDHSINDSRAILLNRRTFMSQSNSTIFTATTATFGDSPILTNSMVGMLVPVSDNWGGDFEYYGVINAINDDTDTVTVDEWRKISDDSIETPGDTSYATIVQFPRNVTIFNNIFDAFDALFTITFDYSPIAAGIVCDYNLYVPGIVMLSNLGKNLGGKISVTTLAGLQTRWTEFADSYPCFTINDTHSIEADPMFIDPNVGDFRLDTNSPCINEGIPTVLDGYTTIGAWQGAVRKTLPPDNCSNWIEEDLSGDCIVDLADFAIFADHWLEDNSE